eukprot:6463980-Prymnesium_polylepis.1
MPPETAPKVHSTMKTSGGGAGGRAWYSAGATNSTTPRQSSARWLWSRRLPARAERRWWGRGSGGV